MRLRADDQRQWYLADKDRGVRCSEGALGAMAAARGPHGEPGDWYVILCPNTLISLGAC